jgi:hypothetical protein
MLNWVFAWWTKKIVTLLQFSLQYKIEQFGDILEKINAQNV